MRGKQINLNQNYLVDCFCKHFHFSVNYSLTAGLAAEQSMSHLFCQTKCIFVICLGRGGLVYMTFQPPFQPLRQAIQWLLSSGGTLPLMEAVWFWVAQLAQIGLIPSISFYVCVLEIESSTLRTQKNLQTEIPAFFLLDISMEGCMSIRSPLDWHQLFRPYSCEYPLLQALGQPLQFW